MAHRTRNKLNELAPPAPRCLVAPLLSRLAYLVAAQLVLALPVGRAQAIESDQDWKAAIAEVDQLSSAELAKHNVGGCTVGVVVDGDLVFAKSYGVADIEANTPATNDHVYRIGSITKQMTGLMLLQLAESGEVRLSDPVKKYLPEIRNVQDRFERSPPITLIQLATMTSGLAREPENLATHLQGPVQDWQKTLITALSDTRFRFEPDTQYHYSNVGYAILGAALSRAAEREFVDYVQEQILNPLQMQHTAFAPNDTIAGAIAKGYTLRSGVADATASQREHAGRGYKVPNGALYTTVGDLAKFVAFELGEGPADVLPKGVVERNFDRANSTNGALSSGYGIGFRVFRHDDLTMIGHGGSVAGYNAAAYVHRPTKTGAIVLRNVGGGRFSAKDLCRRLLAVVAGCRPPTSDVSPQQVPLAQSPERTLTLDGHEIYEGRRVLIDQESYPRQHATIVAGPTLQNKDGQTQIVFTLDKFDDVLVRVVDSKGNTVENLGCGVLGVNAPVPFQKDQLRQVIPWKEAEDSLRAGHRVQVKVGCEPHFDRFIAHDPNQLVKNICGMEVDHQGRLYVSFFTERRGDTEVRRYDRQGNLLDTVYPPSPQGLKGTLSEVSRHVEQIGVQDAFPQRRGGWPFFIYKYHSARENDPTQYPFPFRVAPDGRAYIAEVVSGRVGLTPFEIDRLPAVKARIFDVKLDPFWFLKRMAMGSGVWAIGPHGHGYLCCTNQQAINELKSITLPSYKNEQFIGNTIVKVSLDTVEPVEDFQYSGTEKLDQKRAYIGTLKTKGVGPDFLNSVRDLTVDQHGTLYVVDENRIKTYRANGQFMQTIDQYAIDGTTHRLGDVHGIRAAGDSLYVVGRLDPITRVSDKNQRRGIATTEIQTYKSAVLVKFKISERASPQAVCSIALHGLANVIAVDRSSSTPIVWVGNGGGEACFTRVEDHGQSLIKVKHIRGIRNQVIRYPWSVAVDAKGRVYTYDYDRECLVRTNEDGSEWLESGRVDLNRALFVDRDRGRIYRSTDEGIHCMDLDFNEIEVGFPKGRHNLGGVDREGNLVTTGVGETSFGKPVLKIRNRYGPDGFNGLVDRFSPDGTLNRAGLIETFQGMGGIAVDSKGCIYVMDTCKAQFQYVAHDVGRLKYEGATPFWKRGEKHIHNQSEMTYLVKFSADGGKRGTDAELWAHRGASPVLSQCRCPVVTNTVAVDEADRIFHTDYLRYHVKILDTAGNVIARAGAWGNADNAGPESKHPRPAIAFSWLHGIDAANDALYASDRDLRRIVKVRLDYRETKIAK